MGSRCVLRRAARRSSQPPGGCGRARRPEPPPSRSDRRCAMMVVGAGNVVLSPPARDHRDVSTVSVGGRSCGVAAGTPLAVLADLHLAAARRSRCATTATAAPRAAHSGQLFVYSLDGETNHGQNGWEYKVDNRSGTTGAGDPSGPLGRRPAARCGRAGAVVLVPGLRRRLPADARRRARPATVARGGALRGAACTGYDNEGRGAPMRGRDRDARRGLRRHERLRRGDADARRAGAGATR